MLKKIVMPSAGQTTNELTIAAWKKSVGDTVARGDVLAEIETDKAILSIESFAKGTLLKILVEEGASALVGDVIAYVGEAGDLNADVDPSPSPATNTIDDDDYAPISKHPTPAAQTPPVPTIEAPQGWKASPAAKKAARDRNLSLDEVANVTGKEQIKLADVLNYAPAIPKTVSASQPAITGDELIPLTSMRKTIAHRMLESTTTVPTFTLEVEVDMRGIQALRETLKAQGKKFAFHDLFAKAAAATISGHKLINASWSDQGILCHGAVHVGIAVSIEGGLVVPVVKDVQAKGLGQLCADSATLIAKAREGRLLPEEMSGGTITVSNLGMYPLSRFTAILNPPESCILAFAGTKNTLVLENGVPVEVPTVAVSATFDHRVVDGAYGASFLADYKACLENPAVMLF